MNIAFCCAWFGIVLPVRHADSAPGESNGELAIT